MLTCNEKSNRKGFTLAELLIVVAIIAIIVAVSIPIFTGKLDKAALSTDEANIRAAKAVAIGTYLQDESWQKELQQSDKDPKRIIRCYDAENGTLVSLEDGKKLKPYNKHQWDQFGAEKETSILVIFIQEDKSASNSDEEIPVMISHTWEWPSQLDRVQ